jgi:hypothetical protein
MNFKVLKSFLAVNATFLLIFTLLLSGVGYMGYVAFHKEYVTVPCPDCHGTGKASCGAPGCVNGTVPCPNPECLQFSRGEWIYMHVDGHSDSDQWQKFYNSDGGWEAYSQAHIGHVIQLVNNHWTDMGLCPVCHGTGKAECPVCHGGKLCPTCQGKGTVQKEVKS